MILVIGLYREASNFRERVGNGLRPVHVPPFRPWMPPKRHSSQFSRVKSNCKACHISRYKISLFSVVFFAYSEHSTRAKISMWPRGWPLGWVRIPVHFKHSLSATPAHNLRYIGILFFLTLLAAIAISPEIANGEQFLRLFPKKQSIHFYRNIQK